MDEDTPDIWSLDEDTDVEAITWIAKKLALEERTRAIIRVLKGPKDGLTSHEAFSTDMSRDLKRANLRQIQEFFEVKQGVGRSPSMYIRNEAISGDLEAMFFAMLRVARRIDR